MCVDKRRGKRDVSGKMSERFQEEVGTLGLESLQKHHSDV